MEPASVPICNCRQASASEVCYMELPELPCALDGSVNCNPHSKSSCHYVLSFPFRTTVRGFLYAMLLRRTPCSIMRRAFPLQPRHYDSHRTKWTSQNHWTQFDLPSHLQPRLLQYSNGASRSYKATGTSEPGARALHGQLISEICRHEKGGDLTVVEKSQTRWSASLR